MPDSIGPQAPTLHLRLAGDLPQLVARPYRDQGNRIVYPLRRRASIKDIIESVGIPHTEVGRLCRGEDDLPFSFIPSTTCTLTLYPQGPEIPVTRVTVLRPQPLPAIRFLTDRTVGRLQRLLRAAGLDTAAASHGPMEQIATAAVREQRILLSRNRDLLRHGILVHGHLLRTEQGRLQFAEVVHLYDLTPLLRPFTRCMCCNHLLEPVAKSAILHRLEPLTRQYYHRFSRCPACDRIYWAGSHQERLSRELGLTPDSGHGAQPTGFAS